MKKLFTNTGGNTFKLLNESVINGNELVNSGLKKVFANGGNKISYKQVESVGLGYIRDVSTAQRVSVQEAKRIASEYGYKDDEINENFVKEMGGKPLNEFQTTIKDPDNGQDVDVTIGYEYHKGSVGGRVGMARFAEPDEAAQVEIQSIITHDGRQIDPESLDSHTRENLEIEIADQQGVYESKDVNFRKEGKERLLEKSRKIVAEAKEIAKREFGV